MADCPNDSVKTTISAAVLAPFVKLTAKGGSGQITVGNESAPSSGNRAIIKSFQYGHENGTGAHIEIFDEAGGDFLNFAKNIFKDASKSDGIVLAEVTWGWVFGNCFSDPEPIESKTHRFLIKNIEINYASGGSASGFIFKLELTDIIHTTFETTVKATIGETLPDKAIKLKQAIIEVCKKAKPPVTDVLFLNKEGNGDFDFDANGKSPKSAWPGMANTLVETISEWTKDFRTNNGRGVRVYWDETQGVSGVLILQEASVPPCGFFDSKANAKALDNLKLVGTYVVNGGNQSPVISFNPQMKFPFNAVGHSGATVSAQNDMSSKPGSPTNPEAKGAGPGCRDDNKPERKNVGNAVRGGASVAAIDSGATPRQIQENFILNSRANLVLGPMEAELTIQGDPKFDRPTIIGTSRVGIAFVNPFHVVQCEWGQLASGPCNDCLTDGRWLLKGFSHSIREGSYSTTLKLLLPYLCLT